MTKASKYTEINKGQVTLGPTKQMTPGVICLVGVTTTVGNSATGWRVLFYFPCTRLTPLISSPLSTKTTTQYQLYTRDPKKPWFFNL